MDQEACGARAGSPRLPEPLKRVLCLENMSWVKQPVFQNTEKHNGTLKLDNHTDIGAMKAIRMPFAEDNRGSQVREKRGNRQEDH